MTPTHENRGRLLSRAARVARLLSALVGVGAAAGGCNRVIDAVQSQDCSVRPNDPDCAPTPWPIPGHSANSDPWIVSHHDVITQMLPRVLVLNFFNGATSDAALATAQRQVAAIAEGSRYHGYSDPKAPVFLSYQILRVVDLTDRGSPPPGWTFPSSSKLPVTPDGNFDPLALFTSPQLSQAYGFTDPQGRSLTLCELFEQGIINELWVEDGESTTRRAPLSLERKQIYDASNLAKPGEFLPCVGGRDCLQDLICGVTVRMAHLDPARGPGCDLEVRGWGIEGMWDALPAFENTGAPAAFLNRDFETRYNMPFDGWENLCDSATGAPCVSYPSPKVATGTYNGTTWTIDPFTPACGGTDFPPNARSRWDWTNNTTPVQSSCEHFGLGDGTGGSDALELYTSDKITAADQAYPDCGGGWQIHWRQSIPGLNNHAKIGGIPLRNWWPLLFY